MAAQLDAIKLEQLIELLRERSFERRRVTLASGKESDFFIDCKQTILTARGHVLAGELMLEALDDLPECDAVAGVELGGCPLASAVSLLSYLKPGHHFGLDAFYIRKEAKDHGSKKLIEGDKSMKPGLRVVMLEDVITTGGSTLKAIDKLQHAGAKVVGVVVLVDRQEGGRETIEEAGYPVRSVAKKSDFIAG